MSAAPDLFLAEAAPPQSSPQSPTVFVRTLSAPPGAPWDQARVAALEARVGAPLPLDEVIYQLHRLESWRPGQPGRYAACYVRTEEAGGAFQSKVEVAGRSITVRFLSAEERNRRALRLGAAALAVAAVAFLVGGAFTSALSLRSQIADRLTVVEQTATVKARGAQAEERMHQDAKFLDSEGVRQLTLAAALSDLAWAASAKAADAHVDAYHWDHGRIAVEVRGETAPFAQIDRVAVKDDKPLRPGVWLWGIEPAKALNHAGPP